MWSCSRSDEGSSQARRRACRPAGRPAPLRRARRSPPGSVACAAGSLEQGPVALPGSAGCWRRRPWFHARRRCWRLRCLPGPPGRLDKRFEQAAHRCWNLARWALGPRTSSSRVALGSTAVVERIVDIRRFGLPEIAPPLRPAPGRPSRRALKSPAHRVRLVVTRGSVASEMRPSACTPEKPLDPIRRSTRPRLSMQPPPVDAEPGVPERGHAEAGLDHARKLNTSAAEGTEHGVGSVDPVRDLVRRNAAERQQGTSPAASTARSSA